MKTASCVEEGTSYRLSCVQKVDAGAGAFQGSGPDCYTAPFHGVVNGTSMCAVVGGAGIFFEKENLCNMPLHSMTPNSKLNQESAPAFN